MKKTRSQRLETRQKKMRKKVVKRKKLRLKKPYFSFSFRLVVSIVLFLIFFGVGVYFIINSMNITHEEVITYEEEGKIDYSVCLNENEFFNDECLSKDMSYIASLIKTIPLNFSYKFGLSNGNLTDKMEYEIIGKLVISNKDSNSNYYEKVYHLQDKTTDGVRKVNDNYVVNKNIDIDYDHYNSIANKFKSEYGVDSESYLDVIFIVYNHAPLEYNIPSFSTTLIKIPLSQKSVEIKMTSKEVNQNQNKVVLTNEFNISNWIYLLIGLFSSIISIIFIIVIIRKLEFIKTKKSDYDKKLNKILKEYDRLIVNTRSLPNISNYCQMKIDSFEELLDVRDNLHLPIMYYDVIKHQKAIFYILHDSNIYIYTLKEIDLIGKMKNEKKS